MSNLPFIIVNGLIAAFLITAIAAGSRIWKEIVGKFLVIGAGVLLLLHLAFLALVATIVANGRAGHPF